MSAFLKPGTCLKNLLICYLLVTMWRESRLNTSERRLLNNLVEVLSDLKLTISQCLMVVVICNAKMELILRLNLLSFHLSGPQPLENTRRKELSYGDVLRLSGICLKTADESLINWQVYLVHKYCLTCCCLGCSTWRPQAFLFFIPPDLVPLKTYTQGSVALQSCTLVRFLINSLTGKSPYIVEVTVYFTEVKFGIGAACWCSLNLKNKNPPALNFRRLPAPFVASVLEVVYISGSLLNLE